MMKPSYVMFLLKEGNMSPEAHLLPFDVITDGPEEDYSSYHELTPEALKQLCGVIGKEVNVTVKNEFLRYQGPDEAGDYDSDEIHVRGTLVDVTQKSIEMEVFLGEAISEKSPPVSLEKGRMMFFFYHEVFIKHQVASFSKIKELKTVETSGNQVFEMMPEK